MGSQAKRMKLLDTCFLIELYREIDQDREGPARRYLTQYGEACFAISTVTGLEFLEGFADPEDGEFVFEGLELLAVDGAIAKRGSRIRRSLRRAGRLIGDFDILIAATALHFNMPVVTDNHGHFSRIEGLLVEGYR